jgi:hypothetical protein
MSTLFTSGRRSGRSVTTTQRLRLRPCSFRRRGHSNRATNPAMRFNGTVLLICLTLAGCSNSKYEVIERSQRDVPNFLQSGTHTEVDYVLLHDGHKIYASCDTTTVDKLDPNTTCAFRPLHKYDCDIQSDSMSGAMESKLPSSDLKCRDADGHNVYLYVSKKD